MKRIFPIINGLIIVFAIVTTLWGGLLIAVSCSCLSSAGGFRLDLSPVYSFFGLCFLIIGIWILIKKLKKHKNILHVGIFIYGILLMVASILVNYFTKREISKHYYFETGILSPNGFSVLVAVVTIIGLLAYPFIKENYYDKGE